MNKALKIYSDIFRNLVICMVASMVILVVSSGINTFFALNIKPDIIEFFGLFFGIMLGLFLSSVLTERYYENKEFEKTLHIDDSETLNRMKDRSPIIFNVRRRV